MKYLIFFSLLTITSLNAQQAAPAPSAEAAATTPAAPLTVAVLPFEASEEALKSKASDAPAILGALLSANPDLWMVEREDIDKLISEHALNLSGLADPGKAVETGKVIGAKVLVTGRIIRSGSSAILVAKVISTETSRVFGETAMAPDPNSLEKPVSELSEKISALVSKQRLALAPPVKSRAERIAALKTALQGKPLPTIQVAIAEQDLSRPVIDPAVETEFGKVIQEIGGQVIDAKQGGKADISITGEAISQTGARHGQLTSAKARAEVKATRVSDGKVLVIDRETSVAVDISEATAGKSALQNAGLTLAERILPKLVDN